MSTRSTREQVRRRRLTAWLVVAGALVLLLVAVAVSQGTWVAAALGAVVALSALIGGVSVARDRRRRAAAFAAELGGSLEVARERLDLAHLRDVRDSRGELIAVRDVRRSLPALTVEQAVEIVREL